MTSYSFARRRFPLAALAAGLVLLAGCGGGGDSESSTLVVGFDYPSAAVQARVFEPVSVAPAVSGLQGNTPTFAATDPLPAGLALDSRSGTISGVPTRRGDHIVGVELTVPGYEGRLLSSTRIMVTTPFAFTYGISYEMGLTVGQPMTSPAPTVTGLQAGDQLSFALAPASSVSMTLPAGITLNPNTGVLSGTPTTAQAATFYNVRVTITRGAYTTTLEEFVSMSVRRP